MNLSKRILACVTVILGLTTFAQAAAITSVNEGFESPVIAGFQTFATNSTVGSGWKVVTGNVGLVSTTYSQVPTITFNAQGASLQSLDLTGPGNNGQANAISQEFDTLLGQSYAVSFYVGRADDSGQTSKFRNAPIVNLDITGAGTVGYTSLGKNPNGINWTQSTRFFTATGNKTTLKFSSGTSAAPGGANFAGLDTINVSAVPEPASLAVFSLVGLAVGGVKLRRRRRLSAAV